MMCSLNRAVDVLFSKRLNVCTCLYVFCFNVISKNERGESLHAKANQASMFLFFKETEPK